VNVDPNEMVNDELLSKMITEGKFEEIATEKAKKIAIEMINSTDFELELDRRYSETIVEVNECSNRYLASMTVSEDGDDLVVKLYLQHNCKRKIFRLDG
jgi:hypothetical protein